ncbi:hypothetical protein AN5212.2 [Aspergillus nidulans FGSC A4]|uniref:Telomere replication protein EST3 n=1 Tax=Emericella nidulans (strain FGSC A4 / ATCC 38163 / CBS 112.46 / NRRL 194 / M139) TaxID=227321 RepID=Q5B2L8_EMENI|nr:hypothetical protein [Aspergillus nidulans FGSC A4]EAA62393.1 hypothetical protein AN5212.2 [Aspergillus nidulans FGSC A4]CBF81092.1 TPA: conserved hypothetical protein [Aspergillus nidulans FGSC A4]|eukprot:XP_662816.1 hypothetical protein AN5212.2 [Aspergillus nidulans FGSC A4]
MSSSNHWISLFVEHCLSSYETGRHPGSDWEDDGSNIRFSSSEQQLARITEWSEVNNVPRPRLSDLDTQIEAVLSSGSLQEYNKDFPNKPLNRDRCLGYTIQLDDFELVYEYHAGKPNVHLSGHQAIEPSQETVDSSGQNNGDGDILADGHTQHVRHQFMSQLPRSHSRSPVQSPIHDAVLNSVRQRNTHHMSTSNVSHVHPEKQGAAEGDRGTPTSVSSEPFITQAINRPCSEKATRQNFSPQKAERQSPRGAVERSGYSNSPERQPQSQLQSCEDGIPLPASPDKNAKAKIADPWEGMTGISSVDVTVPADQKELLDSNPTPWYPPPDGCQLASGNVPRALLAEWNELASRRNQIEDNKPKTVDDTRPSTPVSETSSESLADSWVETPNRTPSRGVLLPRDSSPLRDNSVRPQRAQSSGDQHSLENNTDSHMQMVEEEPVSELDRNTDPISKASVAAMAEPNAKAIAPDMVCDDGGHVLEDTQSNSRMASDDSNSNSKINNAPGARPIAPGIGHDDGHYTNVNSESQKDPAVDAGPIAKAQVDKGYQSDGSSNSDDSEKNEAPDVEISNPDPALGGEQESESSSDSEMSVAIPRPLSGSTQQETSTQTVSSPEPSLSEFAGQNVQVVETPAVLSKSRPVLSGQDASRTDLTESQSQPDKSSQSRILNTYASHEGDSNGGTSQWNSMSLPASAPDSLSCVHVMGTPLSSQVSPTQPTPRSPSNSIHTSSGPNVVEGSVPAASLYQTQSSKASSSHHEPHSSSMLSIDDLLNPSIQSSVQGSSFRPDRTSPLKRLASETDSDRGSPLKRSKLDIKPTVVKAEGGLDETIIARHQNYIINSAQSVEAAGIYEKFRGDYPNYAGNYEHFIKLCSRLRSFRERGSLQRSFLWDDFIIKNLDTYPSYLAECHYNHIKPLEYEEYFAETFSKPTYKRRSLDIPGINACAAQVVTIDESVESREPDDAKTSFTASLREQLSKLHTHSFAVQDPTSRNAVSEDGQNAAESDSTSQYSIPDSEPARAAAREHDDDYMNIDHLQETDDLHTVWENSDEDMENTGMDVDVDDTGHETASVELGDDETPTALLTPARHRFCSEPQPDSLVPDRNNKRGVSSPSTSRRNRLTIHTTPERSTLGIASKAASDESVHGDAKHALVPRNKSLTSQPTSETAIDAASGMILNTSTGSKAPSPNKDKEPAHVLTPKRNKFPNGQVVETPTPGTTSNHSGRGMIETVIENRGSAINAAANSNIEAQDTEPYPGPSPIRKTHPALRRPERPTSASAGASVPDKDHDDHIGIHNINNTNDISETEEVALSASPDPKGKGKSRQQEAEDESENENWFTSLRHIFPQRKSTKPVWSDDPHTPLKQWARADQNVLLVRNQRGGLNVPVDERGVIGRIPRKTGLNQGSEHT